MWFWACPPHAPLFDALSSHRTPWSWPWNETYIRRPCFSSIRQNCLQLSGGSTPLKNWASLGSQVLPWNHPCLPLLPGKSRLLIWEWPQKIRDPRPTSHKSKRTPCLFVSSWEITLCAQRTLCWETPLSWHAQAEARHGQGHKKLLQGRPAAVNQRWHQLAMEIHFSKVYLPTFNDSNVPV